MKCLSLWEPWATLVVRGCKLIETRSWATPYRGWLAIHASKRWTQDEKWLLEVEPFRSALARHGVHEDWQPALGAVIGVVRLVDVKPTEQLVDALSPVEEAFGNYDPGRFGWILADHKWLRVPALFKGRQGIFDIPDKICAHLLAA